MIDYILYQLISHLEDNFVYLSPVLGGMGYMPFNSEPTLKEIKYLIKLKITRFFSAKYKEFRARVVF